MDIRTHKTPWPGKILQTFWKDPDGDFLGEEQWQWFETAIGRSKAAVNMAMRSVAIDIEPKGVCCVVVHPGWVQTDMGGPNGLITTDESVSGLRAILDSAGPEQSGNFFDRDGSVIAW